MQGGGSGLGLGVLPGGGGHPPSLPLAAPVSRVGPLVTRTPVASPTRLYPVCRG